MPASQIWITPNAVVPWCHDPLTAHKRSLHISRLQSVRRSTVERNPGDVVCGLSRE